MESVINSKNDLKQWLPWFGDHSTTIDGNIDVVRRYRGNFDSGNDYKYAMFDKDENFVGNIGVHFWHSGRLRGMEIGYWLDTRYTGNGYATEAVRALTKALFEIKKVDKVIIKCKLDNISSIKIPQKLGFKVINYTDTTKILFRLMKDEYVETELPKTSIKAFDAIGRPLEPSGIKIDLSDTSQNVDIQ
jgi:RimJ/RimL family protein N-acetyltransferase